MRLSSIMGPTFVVNVGPIIEKYYEIKEKLKNMKQNNSNLFFEKMDILRLTMYYVKKFTLNHRCIFLYCFLFILLMSACKEKTNEERIRESKVTPKELLNEIALKKQWQNVSIIAKVNEFNFIYKREDNINTYLGEINLKNETYIECYLDSELKGFINDVNYAKKSSYSNIIALFNKYTNEGSPNTFVLLIKPDSTMSITHYNHHFAGFIKDGFTLENISVKIANMEMYSSADVTKNGIVLTGALYNANGQVCGDTEDLHLKEKVKVFVDEKINRILDAEFNNEIENVLNDFIPVEDLVEIGSQNAMRFNDQYRNRTLRLKGKVNDIDEPWLSSYTYRVKMNNCDILTHDRSILNLNKGDIAYIAGICTNFDSNSYSITIKDGKVISFDDIKEYARQSLLNSGRVNHLLNDIDYNVYIENIENPMKI